MKRLHVSLCSSLSTACRRLVTGRTCADCPSRNDSSCPLQDIEDLGPPRLVPPRPNIKKSRGSSQTSALGNLSTLRPASSAMAFRPSSSFSTSTSSGFAQTFHRRPLPERLIRLASPEGKKLFREASDAGTAECYWPLSEQFLTQSEPAYCSIASLAMVLNALNHDPKKTWKGPWRWVSEEVLECAGACGHSLDRIKKSGLNFSEFAALVRCQGARVQPYKAAFVAQDSEAGKQIFRDQIEAVCSDVTTHSHIVANFSRAVLGQTGDGHYSPIAGFHKERDLVLVLDVARFKYPPHWVSLTDMWNAMLAVDSSTQSCRGWFSISTWATAQDSPSSATSEVQNPGLCPPHLLSWGESRDSCMTMCTPQTSVAACC